MCIRDSTEDRVLDRLVEDLGVDPATRRDRDLGLRLIEHYVRFPAVPSSS